MLSTLKKAQQPLIWWLLAASIAAALKGYFSAADSTALGWMLRPLSLLLRLLTGWHFQQTAEGDRQSLEGGIVLVKACSGINFMTMSFMAWCWLARPQNARLRAATWLIEWPLLLSAALVFAWLTALLVNTLRVIAVVAWQPTLQQWLDAAQAHRLIGLVIYLAALSAQFLLDGSRRFDRALILGAAVYIVVMLIVPLLTGNAAANSGLYREHVWVVLVAALPLCTPGLIKCYRSRLQRVDMRRHQAIHHRCHQARQQR